MVLILGAAGLALWGGVMGRTDVSLWADVSLIWLILPWLLFIFIFTVLLAGLVYGVTRLLGTLPGFAFRVQRAFEQVKSLVRLYADRLVEPVLRARGAQAGADALRRSLPRSKR